MSRGSVRIAGVGAGLALLVVLALSSSAGGQGVSGEAAKAGGRTENTCLDPERVRRAKLRCPDLKMRPPFALDRDHVNGIPVLRAANSINNVGAGPAELIGERDGPRSMKAHQKIYRGGGGRIIRKTGAELYFKAIPGQGRYWKFKMAAIFRLFRLNKNGNRVERVETGPKQVYCLRDLDHNHEELPNSPNGRVYPACNQDPNQRKETIGTSVGWADVYPSSYHQNWIELNDIPKRGCYSYVHIADPKNGIFEKNEKNNKASTVVYLTSNGNWQPGRCRGLEDKALPPGQSKDDTQVPKREPIAWGGYY